MKKEVNLQIFTGGFLHMETDFEEVAAKLKYVMSKISIKRVIIGWSPNIDFYKEIKELVHSYGTELYIWLPVFSETGLLKDTHLLLDDNNQQVKSFALKDGENFEFYCPNQEMNLDSFINIYEEYFDSVGFDGVFLDKIRYGAFSNGLSGVFNCFCPKCVEKYQFYGIDIHTLHNEMDKVRNGVDGYDTQPLKITSYSHGQYQFQHPIWKAFFQYKKDSITDSLRQITQYLRNKNVKIGLDVLSPYIAYFTGQNFTSLKDMCDFMKPMMYRTTVAPAGLPFEYDCFLKETLSNYNHLSRKHMNSILHIKGETYPEFELPFVKEELAYLTDMDIPVHCGIEINRIEKVAPVTPKYIKEYLEVLEETAIEGYVLSWNLLSAPEENINEIIKFFT